MELFHDIFKLSLLSKAALKAINNMGVQVEQGDMLRWWPTGGMNVHGGEVIWEHS